MSAVLDQIERRHADRALIIKDSRKIKPPVITDSESVKTHQSLIKHLQADLVDKCFLVEHDFQVVLLAARELANETKKDFGHFVAHAWEKVRMDEKDKEILNKREVAEAEAQEKQDVKNGKIADVPGQQKIPGTSKDKTRIKDDGSTAQPASEVVISKVEPVNAG